MALKWHGGLGRAGGVWQAVTAIVGGSDDEAASTKGACSDAERQKTTSTSPHVIEIRAEHETLDAAREWPAGPALPIAPRCAAGRPRLARRI
jgi:hypothetical protein